jgi:hypothetical protein
VANLAKYAECDVKGTLARFDTNGNNLVEYSGGTLVGNDADAVAFAFFGARPQDRTESSFWYSGALAAAAEYNLLGNTAKANEMTTIANNIKNAILNNLWADAPVGSGGGATGPRVPGRIGNALKLSGATEYVTLPAGIVSGLNNFTIAAWVNPAATSTWSRVFDFGNNTTTNMFLTVNAGSGPRFAITTSGSGAEQRLSATSQLPLNTWSHIAVTLSGNTGTLYVNGTSVATNGSMTIHPTNLGSTTNNWIGRSQYADPYLNATVDDFHIYNSALSQAQIQTLAGGTQGAGNVVAYRFDEASGATATDSSGNGRNGTITGSGSGGTNSCPGKVFLQRDLQTSSPVCWKDQQNFAPFIDGIPPNTANYTRPCAITPTAPSSRSCRRTPRTRPTRPPRSPSAPEAATTSRTSTRRCRPGSSQDPCATTRRSTSLRTRTESSSNGCPGTSSSTAITAIPTTMNSSSTGTRPTRHWAGRAFTTTSSARTTGCSSRTWPASRRGWTTSSSSTRSTWATTTSRSITSATTALT